jgi:hypothetical protein
MRAVIHEVKTLKSSAITTNTFTEALKRKAEEADVQRLIKSLTEAMGNVDGRTGSSIVHTKCLVCDAPVNTLIAPNMSNNMSPPRGVGYDKKLDANLQQRPQTTSGNLMLSRSLNSSSAKIRPMKEKDRVRMSADLRIIRNSIDLPPLDANNNPSNGNSGNNATANLSTAPLEMSDDINHPSMQQPVSAVVMNKTGSNSNMETDSVVDDNSVKQRYNIC